MKTNSKDIKTRFLDYLKGAILDTLPSWLKLFKNYSIKDIDKQRIFFQIQKLPKILQD
jgi:hypothetical protein